MDFNEFTEKIMDLLRDKLGEDYNICRQEVMKNNGICLTGVSITGKGEIISPTYYLDNLYEHCKGEKDLEKIADTIMEKMKEGIPDEMTDFRFYFDYDKVSGRIIYKLINYEKNKELLKDIPHRKFLDLALVYEYYIKSESGIRATILIHENHLQMWGRKEEELYQAARVNTPVLLETEQFDLSDVFGMNIREYGNVKKEVSECELPTMLVVTNRINLFGAVVMLYDGFLAELAERENSDFIILPSSVHELILLPNKNIEDGSMYEDMVRDVNDTELEEQEILSYHVYYYSKKKDTVTLYTDKRNSDDET